MSVSGRVGAVMCMGLNMQGGRGKERLSGPIQGNQMNTHFSYVLKYLEKSKFVYRFDFTESVTTEKD